MFGLPSAMNPFRSFNSESNLRQNESPNEVELTTNTDFNMIHVHYFLKLIEDEVIQEFLEFDCCYKLADKYLLSMVFAYFVRAQLKFSEYTRINFFVALHLAHDVEEDDEELKDCFIAWGFDVSYQRNYHCFNMLRYKLWKAMNFHVYISLNLCNQIMESMPDCQLWERERDVAHGGAARSYNMEWCERCHQNENEISTDSGFSNFPSPPSKRARCNEE